MTAGRKPKPAAQQKLRGNPGQKKDLNDVPESKLYEKLPDCPDWVGEYGQIEWRRVGPVLMEMGLLTEADLMSLATYCQNFHIMIESANELKEEGHTIIGARGRTRNPALASFKAASDSCRQYAGEFGMTPSSRSRFKLPNDDGEDLEDLLQDDGKEEDVS